MKARPARPSPQVGALSPHHTPAPANSGGATTPKVPYRCRQTSRCTKWFELRLGARRAPRGQVPRRSAQARERLSRHHREADAWGSWFGSSAWVATGFGGACSVRRAITVVGIVASTLVAGRGLLVPDWSANRLAMVDSAATRRALTRCGGLTCARLTISRTSGRHPARWNSANRSTSRATSGPVCPPVRHFLQSVSVEVLQPMPQHRPSISSSSVGDT